MSHSDDRLRFELRQAADAYVPDRAAIARRAATRRAAAARRDRIRPAAAALAVVAVAVGGVVTVRLNDPYPSAPEAAVPPPPAASSRAPAPPSGPPVSESSASPSSAAEPPSARPATTPPTRPATTAPGRSPAAPELVTVSGTVDKGSVATWTQNTVTIRADEPTWVEVTVRVERTKDAARAGWFTTVPNSDLTFTAEDTPDALLYTYRLKDGAKLRPGTYVFAAQFSHGSGRAHGGDSFEVDARTGGADATSRGDFIRT